MKRIYLGPAARLLGVIMILLATASPNILNAQITGGTANVAPPTGGFAVDGNLQANIPTPSGLGDWVNGGSGSGGYVLNNNGMPVDPGTTYHLIELYNSSGDNIYTKGKVNTNPNDSSNYTWGSGKAVGKCDMNHAMIHFTTDVSGHVWVIFAADRLVNTGSSYMDFEFLQNTLRQNSTGTFPSEGPNGGRTVGDFILTIAFGNAGAEFQLLRWQAVATGYDYVVPSIEIPAGSVYAAYNSAQISTPYSVFGNNYYIPVSFIESAVDLTALLGAVNPCYNMVVKTIFIKTKTSAGGNSGVEDFFTPLQVNNISLGNANAGPDASICPASSYIMQGEALASPGYTISSTTWTVVGGAGTISDATILTPSVTVTSSPATFRLTVVTVKNDNSCTVHDDVVITAEDLLDPAATCPTTEASYNTDPGQCYATLGFTLGSSDNCPDETTAWSAPGATPSSGSTNDMADIQFPIGTTNVTQTVTDASGRTDECSFEVVVVDPGPTITCATPAASYPADPNVCTYTVPGTELDPTAADDNCSVASVINSKTGTSSLQGASFPIGSTLVTWTVTDGDGNTATCHYNVVVVDTQNPTLTCAVPATEYPADPNVCTYTVPGTALNPTATGDNCSVASVINNKTGTSTLQGAVFPLGSTPVTWTITDGSGNTASCQYNIVVVDHQNPKITCATPAINYPVDPNVCTYTVPGTALNPTATSDNCSIASVVNNKTGTSTLQGAIFPLGSTPVTWTITDGSGNTASCQYVVVVVDTQNPTISCAAPETSYPADPDVCTYTVPGTALNPVSTGDNCSVASVINDKTGTSTLQGAVFSLGSTPVTWTITDGSGNKSTCQYNVVVSDTQDPVFTCAVPETSYPADPNVCTWTVPGTALNPTGTGDNCSVASVINDKTGTSTLQGAVFPLGNTPVTWTITDGSGNATTCSYNIHVIDTQNPTITCAIPATNYPADPDVCTYTVPGTALNPTAMGDNCSVASVVNNKTGTSTLQGAIFQLGTTPVTWTITDGSGNTATCQYDVVVVDAQNPTISCAAPESSYPADPGACTYTVPGTALNPVSTGDNCSVASVINSKTGTSTLQGAVFPLGNTPVTWTITDGSGNTASCSYTIHVADTQNPTITCAIPATSYPANANVCTYTVPGTALNPTATGDNCSIASVINSKTGTSTLQGAVFPLGNTLVTWTITDGSGNTASCSYTIHVIDTQNPTITCAVPATSYPADPGVCTYTVPGTALNPTATGDNCSVASVINSKTGTSTLQGAVFPLGNTPVTWTITDGSGNTATCSYTIHVIDTQNPTISCATPAASYPSNPGVCTYTVPGTALNPVATGDNCSVASVVNSKNGTSNLQGAVFPLGNTLVTWTITDGSGNTATCSYTIHVVDTQNPTITCATPAASYPAGLNVCSYTVPGTALNPTATGDNCSVASVVNNKTGTSTLQGAVFPLGSTLVTWTITDGSGNTANCSYTILVTDTQAPKWITAAGNLNRTVDCNDAAGLAAAQLLFPVASDNCDNDVTDIVKTPGNFVVSGTCTMEGTYTNTWIVTDNNGNTSPVYTQVITIADNTPPTFTPPANIVVEKDADCNSNIDPSNTGTPVGLTDNCDPSPIASWSDETCYSTTVTGQMNHGVGYYYPIVVDGYSGFTASDLQKVHMSFSTQKGKGNVEFTLIAPSGDGIMLIGPYCEGGQCDNLNDMTTYSPNFYPYSSGYTKWINSNYIAPGDGSFTPYAGTSTVNSIADIDYLERYVTKFEDLTGPMNGTWILYGRKWGSATGTMSFNGICITPVDCIYDNLIVRTWTATDACGNASNSYRQTIIIRDVTPPEWSTAEGSLDRIVPVGNANALAAAQALVPAAVDNCDPVLNPVKNPGTFTPLASCPQSGTYTNTWTVFDDCGNQVENVYTQVIIVSDFHAISGKITYNNLLLTPMDLVNLTLYRGAKVIASTTTGTDGSYQFNGLIDGTYRIEAVTNKPSGGVNSLDAGQTNYWWTHRTPIERVRWDAGNFVCADNYINASDAGAIQSYFISGTPLPTPGYWTFYLQQSISDLNPPALENTHVICGNDLLLNYYALCVGDFSRNFIPAPGNGKSACLSTLQLTHNGTIKASAQSVIDLPIRVTNDMQLTALSLILDIPTQLVTVEDVYLGNGRDPSLPGQLDWAVQGSVLRIGWNSLVPIDLPAFSDLLNLKLRTTDEFKPGCPVEISLVNDPLNELADGQYQSIDNAILQTYTIEAFTNGIIDPGDDAPLEIICQPNPFYESTVLEYTLPGSGEVILDLVDKYGQQVNRLVNAHQERGKYVLKVQGINLNPGVYTVTLYLRAGGDLKMKTVKIVRGW